MEAAGTGGRLSVDETRSAIRDRLSRFSPATPASVLPWACTCRDDGCTAVSFEVAPHSDHFQTLMVAMMELTAGPHNEAGLEERENKRETKAQEERSVNAVLSAWDKEASSTGLHLRLLHGDDEGAHVRITLPWTDAAMPTVDIVSEPQGFTKEQAFSVARLIYMANASAAAGLGGIVGGGGGLLSNSLFDLLMPPGHVMGLPQRRSSRGVQAEEDAAGGAGGGASAAEQLVSMGAQVYNCGPAKKQADALPWDFLKGIDPIKEAIEDTVMLQLTNPTSYADVIAGTRGASGHTNRPRAVLFEGPPGCGKTSMARMMASRAQLAMVYLPLEAVVSKWYGEAEKRLAKALDLTGQLASSSGGKGVLLFLDEIEAVGMSRDSDMHEASRRLLSVLLRSIDGVQSKEGVLVIGATNRVGDIDAALRSRFDLAITFGLPELETREQIVKGYTHHLMPAQRRQLAQNLEGFSGRNIKEVCEDTERKWAARIVRGQEREKSLPPLSAYLAAAVARAESGLQR
eukprot:Tamp_12459.p1 GENE.Tamp_12459~~Tamp_12459.p1  ORF type:complete len:586 (-),score=90.54 Tamp_12459:52-1599(-)